MFGAQDVPDMDILLVIVNQLCHTELQIWIRFVPSVSSQQTKNCHVAHGCLRYMTVIRRTVLQLHVTQLMANDETLCISEILAHSKLWLPNNVFPSDLDRLFTVDVPPVIPTDEIVTRMQLIAMQHADVSLHKLFVLAKSPHAITDVT